MIQFMLQAIKNRIRDVVLPTYVQDANSTVEVTTSAKPTISYRGFVFVAVHGPTIKRTPDSELGYYLDQTFYFKTTVSLKIGNTPKYRFGDLQIESPLEGITYLNDIVSSSIHTSLDLYQEATALMHQTFPTADPFLADAPLFISSDDIEERSPTWFLSSKEDRGGIAGLSITSSYQGLRLIRGPSNYLPPRS